MANTTRIAYFDCFSGIAGDMALSALLSAGCPLDELERGLRSIEAFANEWKLEVSDVHKGHGRIAAKSVKVVSIYDGMNLPPPGGDSRREVE